MEGRSREDVKWSPVFAASSTAKHLKCIQCVKVTDYLGGESLNVGDSVELIQLSIYRYMFGMALIETRIIKSLNIQEKCGENNRANNMRISLKTI